MTELTNKLYAIPMPNGAESCEIRGERPGRQYPLLSFYGEGEAVELPVGEYQIMVFNTKTATEEDARKVVAFEELFINGNSQGIYYCDYFVPHDVCEWYKRATDSLHSLLRSKGLDPNKNYAIIEKQSTNEH